MYLLFFAIFAFLSLICCICVSLYICAFGRFVLVFLLFDETRKYKYLTYFFNLLFFQSWFHISKRQESVNIRLLVKQFEYCMSKKSWPNLNSYLQYEMDQDILDIQYKMLCYQKTITYIKVSYDLVLAMYCYWRHNTYCEPGAYSGTYHWHIRIRLPWFVDPIFEVKDLDPSNRVVVADPVKRADWIRCPGLRIRLPWFVDPDPITKVEDLNPIFRVADPYPITRVADPDLITRVTDPD